MNGLNKICAVYHKLGMGYTPSVMYNLHKMGKLSEKGYEICKNYIVKQFLTGIKTMDCC